MSCARLGRPGGLESLEIRCLFATALLPDLTPWVDQSKGYLYNWSLDTSEIPGRTLLRLTSATANVGAGKAEIRGGELNGDGTQKVYQRVYNDDATFIDTLAGSFIHHPEHDHIHFEDFLQYNLLSRPSDNSVGVRVSDGTKTSFCLEDIDPYNRSLPGAPQSATYVTCDAVMQGISIGWADVYDRSLHGQWIDITGVPDGRYWLETIADPDNNLQESNDNNNVARIPIDVHANDNVLANAFNAGALGAAGDVYDEWVGTADKNDYYKFTLGSQSAFSLALNGLSSDADVQLLNAAGAQIVAATANGSTAEAINTTLAAGTYHIRVFQYSGNTTYHLAFSAAPVITPNVSFIKSGDSWRYLDNGSDQGTAWRQVAFSDAAWKSGASQLGYGDGGENTVVAYGPSSGSKYVTTYFRRSFNIANPADIQALQLQLVRDDGAVVYLNGQEILRSNMPTGTISSTTLASSSVGGASESAWTTYAVNSALLTAGTNVIAVEVHQNARDSSDISFDLKLDAASSNVQPPDAPTNLAANAVSSSQITLNWQDNASDNSGYVVDRSTDGVNFSPLITIGDVTTYANTGLPPGSKFYYQVRAVNGSISSTASDIASATTLAAPTVATFIPAGAAWKYLDNGSNQGTAWRATAFSDAAWKTGNAQLGYGDGGEATVVSYGPSSGSKYITTYFRKSFTVADPALVASLTARLIRDDGAVVYLNGQEVWRSNMSTGTIGYRTLASTGIGGTDESTWYTATINKSWLVAGANVIAVEIHQNAGSSSDVSFDFELNATINTSTRAAVVARNAASLFATAAKRARAIDLLDG